MSNPTSSFQALNSAPALQDDQVVVQASMPFTAYLGDLLANDLDADGDALSIVGHGEPEHGTLTLNPDGTATYVPHDGYVGEDRITYVVSDGQGNESTATVHIQVVGASEPANAVPVVQDEYFTLPAGVPVGALLSDLLLNDVDPDGDTLTITNVGDPLHGTLVRNADGSVVYTADAGYTGPEDITYTVSDGRGHEVVGVVHLAIEGPADTGPTAIDDAISVAEDGAIVISPLANDASGNGTAIRIVEVDAPAHGVASMNADGSITYRPSANYHGDDSFGYTIADEQGNVSTARIQVAVTPVNDAPVLGTVRDASGAIVVDPGATWQAASGRYVVQALGANTVTGTVNATDVDGDTLSYSLVGAPAKGTVNVGADGRWTYVNASRASGTQEFQVGVSDGAGGTSVVTVSLNLGPAAPDLLAANDTGGSATDNITANTRPGFAVEAPPAGYTVVLLVDGAQVASTYAAATRVLTPTAVLSEGDHLIAYGYKASAAGAVTTVSADLKVTIDAVQPAPSNAPDLLADSDTGGSAIDNNTRDSRPVFQVGTLPAGASASLYVNNIKVASTFDAVAGTLRPDAALVDAAYTITWRVTNAAGVESGASPALSMIVDTASSNPYLNAAYSNLTAATDLGASNSDGITANARPALYNWALGPGFLGGTYGSASLYVDGVKVDATWDKVAGTLTPREALTDGTHTLTFSITDSAGNESVQNSLPYTVVIDAAIPAAPVMAPDLLGSSDTGLSAVDNITAQARPSFTVREPSVGGRLELVVDGVTVASTYDAVHKTLQPVAALTDGSHDVAVVNVNAAGGKSLPSAALTITIDAISEAPTQAPDLLAETDSGYSNVDNLTASRPSVVIRPLLSGETASLYSDGVKIAAVWNPQANTLTAAQDLVNGARSLTYTVTNAAGMESARSPALVVTMDTTAPVITGVSSLTVATDDGASNYDRITTNTRPALYNIALQGVYFDSQAGANGHAKLYIDGVQVASTWDKTAGTLTPVEAVAPGQHEFSFVLVDQAGNTSAVNAPTALSAPITVTIGTAALKTPTAMAPTLISSDDTGVSAIDNITSKNRPAFLVSAPAAGGSFELRVDGVVVAATYNATYKTLTPNVALSDGVHSISYVAKTSSGTAESSVLTITVDAVMEALAKAPDLADSSDTGYANTDNLTSSTRPDFSIRTLVGGEQARLYVDGIQVASTYDPATATLRPVVAISDATHSIAYTVVNAAGVESARSPALSMRVDSVAPSVLSLDANSNLTQATDLGLSNNDGVTSHTRPSLYNSVLTNTNLSGANGSAHLFVDGVEVAAVWDRAAGTLTPTQALGEGRHDLTFSIVDEAGNESLMNTRPLAVTIDTQAPPAPATAPDMLSNSDTGTSASDNVTAGTRPVFMVGAPLSGGRLDLLVDGNVVAATYDATQRTLTPTQALSEGTHTISTVNVSAAGARSTASASLTIDIDAIKEAPTAAPTLTAASDSGSSDSDRITQVVRPTFGVGFLPKTGDVANLYVDNVKVASVYDEGAGTLTPMGALNSGAHNIGWSITNAAGVESSRSALVSLTIDTTPPTAPGVPDLVAASDTGSSSTDNITADVLPGFVVTGAGATDTVSLYVDGVLVDATYVASTRTVTPTEPLSEGLHQVSARIVDAAGNASAASGLLSVDIRTHGPVMPGHAPDLQAASDNGASSTDDVTSVQQPVFSIPVPAAGVTALLYVDGERVVATYANGSLKPAAALSEGTHWISYRLMDNATGVQSVASPVLPIRVANGSAIQGGDGNDSLLADLPNNEMVIHRSLAGGGEEAVQTTTMDQYIDARGGNDVVDSGDGHDWIQLGGSAGSAHPLTGLAPTAADVAATHFMTAEDWELTDSFGGLVSVVDNGVPLAAWADVANAGWGDDVVKAEVGTGLLYGNFGNDFLDGGAGTDGLRGGVGDDTLRGGSGDDVLRGDYGSDSFLWRQGDAGAQGHPATDTIQDFEIQPVAEGGDVLELRDLLVGAMPGANGDAGNLANYLEFDTASAPGSTTIHVSTTGGFSDGAYSAGAEDQTILLRDVDVRAALALGPAATDAQIVESLLRNGNLAVSG